MTDTLLSYFFYSLLLSWSPWIHGVALGLYLLKSSRLMSIEIPIINISRCDDKKKNGKQKYSNIRKRHGAFWLRLVCVFSNHAWMEHVDSFTKFHYMIIYTYMHNICITPEGSILGLLLFVIYMNDIFMASENFDFILYADDINLDLKSIHEHKKCLMMWTWYCKK